MNKLNLFDREKTGRIDYEIGDRGGYYKMMTEEALELIGENGSELINLPDCIGCGCNYLGGGVRGKVFGSGDFVKHGINERVAKKLDELVALMIERYIELEGSMNDDFDDEGETNWNAEATKQARMTGTVSVY